MQNVVDNWLNLTQVIGWLSLAYSILLVFGYFSLLRGMKRRTQKYELASAKESGYFRQAGYVFSIAIGFFTFTAISKGMGYVEGHFYLFIGLLSGLVAYAIGYIFWAYFKYYYPFILEKRLHHIRFSPMRSKVTGNPMRLLNETEEDVHLSAGMIEEENDFGIDYDVWIDDVTGHKVIEKYDTHYHTLICDDCNFRTLKEYKDEVIKEPTDEEDGIYRKHSRCSYCGHYQTMEASIPSKNKKRELNELEETADE